MTILIRFSLIFSVLLITGCTQQPALGEPIIIPANCQLSPGEEIPFSLKGTFPSDVTVRWEATKGSIAPPIGFSVIYTAPQEPGKIVVSSMISARDYKWSTSIVCNIVAFPVDKTPIIKPDYSPEETVEILLHSTKEFVITINTEMVHVPVGSFTMGSSYNTLLDFDPAHTVTINDFYLDKYEITNAQYKQCVLANHCLPPTSNNSKTRDQYFDNLDKYGNFPVIFISWYDANKFCEWRGGRLPTEAEWEKAAKWKTRNETEIRLYPWGRSSPTYESANYNNSDTAEVGKYMKGQSALGIYDLAGNVYEWIADDYEENFYQNSPLNDPFNISNSASYKVAKRGAWSSSDIFELWTFWRFNFPPGMARDDLGFRCASDNAP